MRKEQFVRIWNRSKSVSEVMERTGKTRTACTVQAHRLRKLGMRLKIMPKPIRMTLRERFLEKVFFAPSGCWIWTGSRNPKGYGQIQEGRRGGLPLLAHRLSYRLHCGRIKSGLCVLHKCDTPPCVNPDHLFLGTKSDNTQDMIAKKRGWWMKARSA